MPETSAISCTTREIKTKHSLVTFEISVTRLNMLTLISFPFLSDLRLDRGWAKKCLEKTIVVRILYFPSAADSSDNKFMDMTGSGSLCHSGMPRSSSEVQVISFDTVFSFLYTIADVVHH